GASCTQRKVSVVSFGIISSDSFLPSILLLVVIMVTVVVVVVTIILVIVVIAIVGVVIVVVVIGIVVVISGVSSIIKLLFVIIARVVTRWLLAEGGQRCGEGEGGGEMAEMVMVLAGAWPESGQNTAGRKGGAEKLKGMCVFLGQMTYLVASLTHDSANSCVMQGASCTQRKIYMLVVIIVTVVIVVVILIVVVVAIVGVVIVVVIIG
nr:hypothetical protein [Tanacetum cinerariifolium]